MYTQIFFVTSVRGSDFAPQIPANAGLRTFLAKMPFPAFFMARAFFLADALLAILPAVFFAALIFFNSALVIVVFVVFTAAVLVVVVIAMKERRCKHALSLEPKWLRSWQQPSWPSPVPS